MTPPRSSATLPLFEREEPSSALATNTSVFSDNMTLPVDRWFRYSAGFSRTWAESLIREQSASRRASVLDPFVGSGTTLIAAQRAGARAAIGLERHPFVNRIVAAKLAWQEDPEAFAARAEEVLRSATPAELTAVPPLLEKCYPSETLAVLRGLLDAVERSRRGDAIDRLLWLAVVSILRECSPVGTANWQYVLPNKRKGRISDPRDAFRTKVDRMAEDMVVMQFAATTTTLVELRDCDARTCDGIPDESIDIVVTSPPYPNNFDYADATRLEMTFLGELQSWGDLQNAVRKHLVRSCSQHMSSDFDGVDVLGRPSLAPIADELNDVFQQLSELRQTRAGKKRYDAMIVAYFADLADVWIALRRVCAPGASVCFVVGDSAPYGVHVPVERWLGELALSAGFTSYSFEKLRDRNGKWLNRKHRVPLQEGRLWVTG